MLKKFFLYLLWQGVNKPKGKEWIFTLFTISFEIVIILGIWYLIFCNDELMLNFLTKIILFIYLGLDILCWGALQDNEFKNKSSFKKILYDGVFQNATRIFIAPLVLIYKLKKFGA